MIISLYALEKNLLFELPITNTLLFIIIAGVVSLNEIRPKLLKFLEIGLLFWILSFIIIKCNFGKEVFHKNGK